MTLLISRSGIAAAAQVQRPVVSMWRTRASVHGEQVPFPGPVAADPELFDLDEVIAWQSRTGRGNNPAFAEDAALYAVADGPAGAGVDPETALIALAAVEDVDLRTADPAELVAAARRIDPGDAILLTEVIAAAGDAALRELAERKIDAAYGASAAIEAIVAARSRSGPERSWTLTDAVVALVGNLCRSLVPIGLVVSDGVPQLPGDLALRVALADPERSVGWSASAEALDGGSPASAEAPGVRVLRRRALAAGVVSAETEGGIAVVQVPHRDNPEADAVAVLGTLDDCVLSLRPGAAAVAIGPASVLCDELADREARLARADLLRTGRLRAAVRLPRGLVIDRPRAELGLWLLGDADPQADLGERLLVTGDVSDRDLGEVMDALVSDLDAALGGVAQIRARAFAHCRPTRTARLLATDTALVSRAPSSGRSGPAGAAAVDALTSWQRAKESGVLLSFTVETAAEPAPGTMTTVGELVAAGRARLVPGSRVPQGQIGDGPVRVIAAAEVAGGAPTGGLDPLVAHAGYRLTEPGDVVIVSRPRPRALVDEAGGSVVAAPARVLRLRDGSPHAVAVAINGLPERASRVETWSVPVPAASETPGLEEALRWLTARRSVLRARLAAVEDLESDLVDGVTSGALVVSPREVE